MEAATAHQVASVAVWAPATSILSVEQATRAQAAFDYPDQAESAESVLLCRVLEEEVGCSWDPMTPSLAVFAIRTAVVVCRTLNQDRWRDREGRGCLRELCRLVRGLIPLCLGRRRRLLVEVEGLGFRVQGGRLVELLDRGWERDQDRGGRFREFIQHGVEVVLCCVVWLTWF